MYDMLTNIGIVVTAVSLIVLVYASTSRRHWQRPLRIYWYFLLASLLCYALEQAFIWCATHYWPLIQPFATACDIQSTNFLRITNHLTNFIMLGWFFSRVLKPGYFSNWVKPISGVCILVVLLNYFAGEGHNVSGSINSLLSALYCTTGAMILMWQLFRCNENVAPTRNPYFWISLGLLAPAGLSLFIYFAGNTIQQIDADLYSRLGIFRGTVEIIAQIFTAIGYRFAFLEKYL